MRSFLEREDKKASTNKAFGRSNCSRSWAFDMKLTSRDNCRHCGTQYESLDHLFGDCTAIDYTLLREFFSKSSQIFRRFKSIQARASKHDDALHTDYINALCSFVNSNDLFSRENC